MIKIEIPNSAKLLIAVVYRALKVALIEMYVVCIDIHSVIV